MRKHDQPDHEGLFLQAIEELARTSIEQVLKLLDGNERFQSQTQSQMMWGSEDSKMGGWTSTRAYKQVAKAKLDLNKTRCSWWRLGGL